ncbi:MAG: alanine racemase [Synergistaceae bacterium]|nr:alanine racemase [Synergistaceae bacterium]
MSGIFNPIWTQEQINAAFNCGEKTPYYYFDADIFRNSIDRIKSLMPSGVKICYAVKSNTWLADYALPNADYVEVCSPGELELTRHLNIPDEVIVADGVCKTNEDMNTLAQSSVRRIVVESVRQAEILNECACALGVVKKVLLRLSSGSQFGMSEEDIEYIMSHKASFPALNICGLHCYFGTQKRNASELRRSFAAIKALADRLALRETEFGPGLGAVQSPSQDKNTYAECLEAVCEGFSKLAENHEAVIECGRLFAAYAGVYVTSISERKTIGSRKFCITDGGSNHLVYDGQAYGSPVPFIVPEAADGEAEKVIVCGALCAETDILANGAELSGAHEGTRLMFMSAGAYGVTEGRSLFLSRALPAVVCRKGEETITLRGHTDTWQINTRRR